jgi:signal transduction histidine kinase
MVIQAEGIPRVLATGETPRAEHALAVIEETGRDALAEMRRLLGVLRRDGEEPSLAPPPTLAEVERLAGRVRGDGLVVALGFEGERIQLPPGADLAAYRVLEEALDAAGSGGASVADVVIGFGSDELRLDVRDDRADAGVDPEPLLAMRERLGLYGGRVRAGKADDGPGFRVTARLPLNGSAA